MLLKSIIQEKSLELQVLEAYEAGIKALKQNDVLYFDTSDSSNFGHRLSFFTTKPSS